MNTRISKLILFYFFFSPFILQAQKTLTAGDLIAKARYFSINQDYKLSPEISKILQEEISQNQFVGLAELHQSQQLSFFTAALIDLLQKESFQYFAMEVGPFSAQTLQHISSNPNKTADRIKALNVAYGHKLFQMTPLIFADRKEDVLFIERASELQFEFWGLDQEFIFSYEMHLDTLYSQATSKTEALKKNYLECKSIIKQWGRKSAKSRKFAFNCKLQQDPALKTFFDYFKGNEQAEERIRALQLSWDVYCKNESGKNSNQQRADYMKANFDKKYVAAQTGEKPKVFVKMGSVHLTKGRSPFGVDDLGKHLLEKSQKNNSGFLNIRHLSRYRNGKDLIGKKGWERVGLLMEAGKKDRWTLVDLRPFREKLKSEELKTDKAIAYEIYNYDLLLIPPDDRKSTPNF